MVARSGTSTPALTPASTPREPSAFITTTDQLPSSTSQATVCLSAPWAEAAQKSCVLGGVGGASPACRS
jgi:hypothetical protein